MTTLSSAHILLLVFLTPLLVFSAEPSAPTSSTQGEIWTAVANAEWKPADQGNNEVIPGSALDLTSVFPAPIEAGTNGFSMINEKGELVFSKTPTAPTRFRCVSATPNRGSEMLSKEECDRYADQLVRDGYNAYRPHFLDSVLMVGSKEDLVLNPERLDRWDYFAAALKKRGVYLYIDAISSWAAYYAVPNTWGKEAKDKNLPVRMYYDEAARAHWKEGVKRFLEHVNPYTGVALKDEPQVMVVQLRNEAGLNFKCYIPNGITPGIENAFRTWLKKRYGTTEKLKAAWTRKEESALVSYLRVGQTLETVEWPRFDGRGPDSRDLQLFFTDIERETTLWMVKTIREIGVKVPLIDYNNGYSLQTAYSRDILSLVDSHAYHDHPSNYIEAGSRINATSSLEGGLAYYQLMAGTRQLGRPFFCSEWGHVFWNPWRHEAGLTIPSYASLQGWQFITQFAHPVNLTYRTPIKPFALYNDPPLRAAEYMSALLFRRGDVQESNHLIEVTIDPAALPATRSLQDALSASLTRLALLSGFGIRVVGLPDSAPRAPYRSDKSLIPNEGDKVITREGVQETEGNSNTGQTRLTEWVAQLRTQGILGAENQTDVAKGIYESDTGQILLDEKNHRLRVVTSRSLGISLPQGSPELKAGPATIRNQGANATFFLGSLTTQPISESRRLLLIVATDALNSGMSFTDAKRLKIVTLGGFPVLSQVAKVQFSLKHNRAHQLKLWALSSNGARREEIPLKINDGLASGEIDTSKLANGPTPYFELQEQAAEN